MKIKDLKEQINSADLSIDELAGLFADIVIEDYGKHNYGKFIKAVLSILSSPVESISALKKRFGIQDKDIATWFGYKNPMSYYNAKGGKTKIEEGLVKFYEHINKKVNTNQ